MNRYWWGSGNDSGIHLRAWDKLCVPKKHEGLGFKELRAFNLATLGNNLSFCWRSIMVAQDMVCSGVRRRIGNGETTLIWEHPWLLDEHDPMIQTERVPHLAKAPIRGIGMEIRGVATLSNTAIDEYLETIMIHWAILINGLTYGSLRSHPNGKLFCGKP
ncbi:PREDICTED: uncharacterized protein LOC109150222 [Ipomoea nil]|uniref:uncharacterized protein LOC109150222 n=1 Tax=Ipomoea nil TaxID=35883 RepID=UPI0009012E21|nr:PREDICTED: uncharacterized protein LOC109150222 [Ipomoea nil]